MSAEWIKMTTGLRRHPKVVRIVSALRTDRLRVVGALHAVWSVFDEHSIDGRLDGYSFEQLDLEIGWPGFSEALHGIGWLERDGDCGLVIPEFSTHNGASAKRRAEDSLRKKEEREAAKKASEDDPEPVRKKPDRKRTRKEKKRSSSSPNGEEGARATKGKPGTPIPEGFSISPAVREWARKKGFESFLELHFEQLIDYAKSGTQGGKQVLAIDWDAKFRRCIADDWGNVREKAQRAAARGNGTVSTLRWKAGAEPAAVLKEVAAKLQIDPWQPGETQGQFRRRIAAEPGGEELLSPRKAMA